MTHDCQEYFLFFHQLRMPLQVPEIKTWTGEKPYFLGRYGHFLNLLYDKHNQAFEVERSAELASDPCSKPGIKRTRNLC